MKREAVHRNDRQRVSRINPTTPEARQRVITALKARADEDLIALVQWLTVDKQKGNPIPFVKCESLRSAIANLETLKAGVHTRWKQALGLMEAEIQKSHRSKASIPAPSQIVTGVLSSLNDISEKIASGNAVPGMLGRLENMQQVITKLEGSEELAKSINIVIQQAQDALRGYRKPQPKSKTRKPERINPAIREEQTFRDECAPLTGESDIFVIANCLISMSARLGQSPLVWLKGQQL
jgi:hypothetical protein